MMMIVLFYQNTFNSWSLNRVFCVIGGQNHKINTIPSGLILKCTVGSVSLSLPVFWSFAVISKVISVNALTLGMSASFA